MPEIDAWWFAASDKLPHGDGRKVVIGKTHRLRGEIVLCEHALHAARDPFDALQYAPGSLLYKVRCGGTIYEDDDKLGCSARTYLDMRDATDMLRAFARGEALTVAHLWDMPDIVRQYLETGDESTRAAARDATGAATGSATRAAARDATRAATRAAAWAATEDAAWDARDAAKAAAWAVARDAARDATWAAAWAAWDAARDAAWDASRKRFNAAVAALFAEARNAR